MVNVIGTFNCTEFILLARLMVIRLKIKNFQYFNYPFV